VNVSTFLCLHKCKRLLAEYLHTEHEASHLTYMHVWRIILRTGTCAVHYVNVWLSQNVNCVSM